LPFSELIVQSQKEEIMLVKDIMQEPVLTCLPNSSVKDAHAIMRENGFRHLPVVNEKDEIIGVLTEHSIRNVIILYRSKGKEQNLSDLDILGTFTAEQVLSKNYQSIEPSSTIKSVAVMLKENKNGCILVLDNEKVMGIVTVIDILRYVAEKED
jgi:acetoin utilization protein AcuB